MGGSPTRRICAVLCATFGLLLGAPVSHAESPHDRSLTVSGDVHAALDLTTSELRAYPSRTELVTFVTDAGPQTHVYEGAPLEALITASQPIVDDAAEHPLLTVAIVAIGGDGYAATLSWADAAPPLARRPALVAWMEDGVWLDGPRLVVPGDVGGARYVKGLSELRVVQLAPE
ncbi:molybdopterin-dependent oxidoreductase [Mycolicibacterium baixiangningiae]|uniref:molybdopterin-dependent oxidoreductase n=1 Tax=Mycolicibacterium baixiangningiae TaxID=2761578 RepID=UPI001D02D6CE|nr:molybdopterin-dependent oxidoreductase [Mycolicibacterium baixiangningiae]